jgi:hypothetical protein
MAKLMMFLELRFRAYQTVMSEMAHASKSMWF